MNISTLIRSTPWVLVPGLAGQFNSGCSKGPLDPPLKVRNARLLSYSANPDPGPGRAPALRPPAGRPGLALGAGGQAGTGRLDRAARHVKHAGMDPCPGGATSCIGGSKVLKLVQARRRRRRGTAAAAVSSRVLSCQCSWNHCHWARGRQSRRSNHIATASRIAIGRSHSACPDRTNPHTHAHARSRVRKLFARERARAISWCVALHQLESRDVQPLQLHDGVDERKARGDGVDFVQKRREGSARRRACRCNSGCAARCCTALKRTALWSTVLHCAAACGRVDRTHNTRHSGELFGPADRASPPAGLPPALT